MSYDDGNELVDHTLFGMTFKATQAEQRALWLKLSTSQQSRTWGIQRNIMHLVVSRSLTQDVCDIANRMDDADTAMTRLTAKLIDEMIAARTA